MGSIASWDGSSLSDVTDRAGLKGILRGQILAMAVFRGVLYFGGRFVQMRQSHPPHARDPSRPPTTTAYKRPLVQQNDPRRFDLFTDSSSVNGLGTFDGNFFSSHTSLNTGMVGMTALDSGYVPSVDVYSLAVFGDKLYVAGGTSPSWSFPSIKTFDGRYWKSLNSQFLGLLDKLGNFLDRELLLGGLFWGFTDDSAYNSSLANVASYNGTTYTRLDSVDGPSPGMPVSVNAFASFNGVQIAGGSPVYGTQDALFKLGPDDRWAPIPNGTISLVTDLLETPSQLLVSGMSPSNYDGMQAWDGATWSNAGKCKDFVGSRDGFISTMAIFNGTLFFGGSFMTIANWDMAPVNFGSIGMINI